MYIILHFFWTFPFFSGLSGLVVAFSVCQVLRETIVKKKKERKKEITPFETQFRLD